MTAAIKHGAVGSEHEFDYWDEGVYVAHVWHSDKGEWTVMAEGAVILGRFASRALALDACAAVDHEPSDDDIYNGPGVEGGIAYGPDDSPGSLGENDWRL